MLPKVRGAALVSALVVALMAATLAESVALARDGATAANCAGAVWADITPSDVIAPVTGAAIGTFAPGVAFALGLPPELTPAVLVPADCSAALVVESAA